MSQSDIMDSGHEVAVMDETGDPSSIAYTVEIRLVDDGYAVGHQENVIHMVSEQLVEDIPQVQPNDVQVEVITDDPNDGMNVSHGMTTEQMEENLMVTSFPGSTDHFTTLPAMSHHQIVTGDMVTYLPVSSIDHSQPHHHQIINHHGEGIGEMKLVQSLPSDPKQTVLLMEAPPQDPNQTESAVHDQSDTIKEMEIASAVEALEALTGLSNTFNAWAQQNPQGLPITEQELQPPLIKKKHKVKSGKHKSKKHKSGKHKKKKAKASDHNGDILQSPEDPCRCETCGKVFGSRLKLKNHLISHSDERPHVCDVCGSAFKRPRYLQIHKKSHYSDTVFACQYCDKTYFEKKRLRSHEKCHINPFSCDVCGKAYGDKRGLVIHYRTHTNEKPFLCRICERGFTSKAGVNKHERSHSGLKPYVCKICGKAYTQPTNLTDHERTHINDRTFACISCPKVFLARSSLRRHRVKNHPLEKPNVGKLQPLHSRQCIFKKITNLDQKGHYKYCCNICDKKFKKEKYLNKHKKIHTVGTRSCSYCNKLFRDKRDLLNHERRHTGEKPFKCNTCDKAFVSSSAMLRHEKCHLGLKPYICNTCGKSFTRTTGLRDHELIHNGRNKRFPCTFCDKIFASRSALRSHERLKHLLGEIVEPPSATMEVPVETDPSVNYIKLVFSEPSVMLKKQ
ncbi:oocyte zinc finger protein XlCOF6-like isoform X1 [Asterias rubens]|uniref:oocyte zinc finger protein XlCOF6-like isoform X1 n=1 Tax=Asterias rubens TaxID=7604 RepID=UPI001455D47D|nr:oocyte zinc finger protein XlCOF6-like isoform X1 [Asterias rubens]XP_033631698.1 oocyte zinc finger protein XlCOF6-like isoform X1 [Asterias rubens]